MVIRLRGDDLVRKYAVQTNFGSQQRGEDCDYPQERWKYKLGQKDDHKDIRYDDRKIWQSGVWNSEQRSVD